MRVARIVALWLLAIVLGALHEAEDRRPTSPVRPPEALSARLLDVPESAALAVRIVDGPVEVTLARRGGRWAVIEPAEAAVPADLTAAFVEALFAAVLLEDGASVAQDPDVVGLDERRRIEIDTADGSRRVLVVGGETPTGTSAYVRDAGGMIRIVGRNALVYRQLLVDAARARSEVDPPVGPVAQEPLTRTAGPG